MTTPSLHLLVRVPKSGSTSLNRMFTEALPDNRLYHAQETARTVPRHGHVYERLRNRRRRLRHFMQHGAVTEAGFWRKLTARARDGDIVAGHILYGEPRLPGFQLRYVTLLREPGDRILSNYNYDRQGYLKRPGWRRAYLAGQLRAAGQGEFIDYLHYLADADSRAILPARTYVTGDDQTADPFAFLRERYFHFGVLERLDLFAGQLGDKLGRSVGAEWRNRTAERRKTALSAEERRLIEKIFAGDMELYEQTRAAVGAT